MDGWMDVFFFFLTIWLGGYSAIKHLYAVGNLKTEYCNYAGHTTVVNSLGKPCVRHKMILSTAISCELSAIDCFT